MSLFIENGKGFYIPKELRVCKVPSGETFFSMDMPAGAFSSCWPARGDSFGENSVKNTICNSGVSLTFKNNQLYATCLLHDRSVTFLTDFEFFMQSLGYMSVVNGHIVSAVKIGINTSGVPVLVPVDHPDFQRRIIQTSSLSRMRLFSKKDFLNYEVGSVFQSFCLPNSRLIYLGQDEKGPVFYTKMQDVALINKQLTANVVATLNSSKSTENTVRSLFSGKAGSAMHKDLLGKGILLRLDKHLLVPAGEIDASYDWSSLISNTASSLTWNKMSDEYRSAVFKDDERLMTHLELDSLYYCIRLRNTVQLWLQVSRLNDGRFACYTFGKLMVNSGRFAYEIKPSIEEAIQETLINHQSYPKGAWPFEAVPAGYDVNGLTLFRSHLVYKWNSSFTMEN